MARVRAPELTGRGWLNTGGKQLSIKDLRGKIVLLDFWTSLLEPSTPALPVAGIPRFFGGTE